MNVLTYGEWRDTCDTVHMLLQMMGKAKLQSMDPQPEWKQVVLDADANGFTTGLIPFGADGFEINLNIADAEMAAMTAAGDCARFSIEECVSVSELYGRFTAMLENIGHPIAINTVPQEMHTEVPFDRQNIAREFDAAPSLFWGTFDMTTVLFSGKPCPFERTASIVERVAFDEQFVEFGFWPGDDATNDPSFFVLAYPFVEKGSSSDANVDEAFFDAESSEYFLRLKDALRYDDPQAAVRRFCSSTFARIMERQNWERRDWFTEPLLNG